MQPRRDYFGTVMDAEKANCSHLRRRVLPSLPLSIVMVNWSAAGEIGFRSMSMRTKSWLASYFVPHWPVCLFVYNQLGQAVLLRLEEKCIRSVGNACAADRDIMIGREHGRFIRAHSPDLAERHEAAPDLALLLRLGVARVGTAVDDLDVGAIDRGGDGFVRADALVFLRTKGKERDESSNPTTVMTLFMPAT